MTFFRNLIAWLAFYCCFCGIEWNNKSFITIMNNRSIILALGLSMALSLGAQTRDGGISQQMLDDIRKAEA